MFNQHDKRWTTQGQIWQIIYCDIYVLFSCQQEALGCSVRFITQAPPWGLEPTGV